MWWLLREDKLRYLEEARKSGLAPTAEQRAEFERRISEARELGRPLSLSIAGDVAEIRVEGVLTKDPDIFMMWFGGGNTAYRDIQAALAVAESDPTVKRAVLQIDSPGGDVDGLFDCLAALESFNKPLTARASEACSAAYAIACMAKKIEATNAAAVFGSIGVAARYVVWSDVEIIDITSTEAPDKRPDPTTEEGRAVIRKHLDDIHELFAGAIAKGRETTLAKVNAEFGRGAVLLASEAKKRGMIDSVAQPALRAVSDNQNRASSDGGGQARVNMDQKELQEKHPNLYAAVLAEGEKRGATKERDRVCAHLELGQQSGALETAIKAVTEGTEMTQTMTAKYLAAGMNRSAQSARQADDNSTGKVVENAKEGAAAETKDIGDQIVELMDKNKKKVG